MNGIALKGQNKQAGGIIFVAPFQGLGFGRAAFPRALPWATLFDSFGAKKRRNCNEREPGSSIEPLVYAASLDKKTLSD